MILTLYIVLTVISLICIIGGYILNDILLKTIGWSILFIPNIAVTFAGLEYHTGDYIEEITATETQVTMQYTTYYNIIIFLTLSVLATVGAFLTSYFEYQYREGNY